MGRGEIGGGVIRLWRWCGGDVEMEVYVRLGDDVNIVNVGLLGGFATVCIRDFRLYWTFPIMQNIMH